MATRPTDYPRWATTEVEVTEPPEPRKASGYIAGDKPRRQWENYIKNLMYKWIRYLDENGVNLSFLIESAAFSAGGDLPGTGAGLGPIAAADFSASGLVNGYLVGTIADPIESPIHTYAASSDTYWDLGIGSIWTPAVVANAAPAPAIPADHIRVYKVITDGSSRTSVVDYRQPVTFPESMIFEAVQTMAAIQFRDPDGNEDDYFPRMDYVHDQASFYGQLIAEYKTASNGRIFRVYRTNATPNPAAGDSLMLTVNAKMISDTAPQWQLDAGQTFAWKWRLAATDFSGSGSGNITQLVYQGVTPSGGAGSTFNETEWGDYTDGQERGFFGLNTGVLIGNNLNTEAAAAAQNRAPMIRIPESQYSVWTLIEESRPNTGGFLIHRRYFGQNAFGGGASFADGRLEATIQTINAEWNEVTQKWDADTAGSESAGFLMSNEGFSYLKRMAADPSSWDDIVWDGAEGWRATDTRVETTGNDQRVLFPFRTVRASGFRYYATHEGYSVTQPGEVGLPSGAGVSHVGGTVGFGDLIRFLTSADSTDWIVIPLHVPQGATLTDVELYVITTSTDYEAIVRKEAKVTGAATALDSGGAVTLSSTAGVRALRNLTLDGNGGSHNVVDNNAFRYYVSIKKLNANATELDFFMAQSVYTMVDVLL